MTDQERIEELYNNPFCDLPWIYRNLISAKIQKLKLNESYYRLWFSIVLQSGTPSFGRCNCW